MAGNGMWTPRRAARCTPCAAALPLWFPRVNEILRLIGSHNLLATPTAGADGRHGRCGR